MRRPSVVSFLSDAMLQPPAGLHCTAAHYRTRRNLFRVASTGQTTHTYAPTRTFYSPAFRSVGSSFKLRSPSLDRDPVLELKTMMIAIVAIYGVALTTRFAEGDDIDVVADTRFFPPPWRPPVGVLFQDSCANKFPPPARRFLPMHSNLRPSVASQCDSRVLQLVAVLFLV